MALAPMATKGGVLAACTDGGSALRSQCQRDDDMPFEPTTSTPKCPGWPGVAAPMVPPMAVVMATDGSLADQVNVTPAWLAETLNGAALPTTTCTGPCGMPSSCGGGVPCGVASHWLGAPSQSPSTLVIHISAACVTSSAAAGVGPPGR